MKLPKSKIDYFCNDSLRQNLKAKAVRGGVATIVGQGAQIVIGLVSYAVLGHLLTAADFGLVAVATVLTGFASILVNAGLSMATIQRETITHEQVSNLFWISATAGTTLAILFVGISPLAAWFYEDERLFPLLLLLSTNFVLSGLTIQHQALLARSMRFEMLRTIGILSMTVGQAVGIAWAFIFYETPSAYWGLALIPVTMGVVRMGMSWTATGWLPGRPKRGIGTRHMNDMGMMLTFGQLVNYFSTYFDQLLVGKILGAPALGLYERSTKLVLQPLRQISEPIRAVMLPTLSRLNDSPGGYLRAYQKSVVATSLAWMPIAALCIVNADYVILTILDQDFAGAIPVLRRLSFAILVMPICNSSGWLFVSQDRASEQLRFQSVDAVGRIALVAAAMPWGLNGIAVSYALRMWICAPFLFWYVGRKGPVNSRHMYRLQGIMLLIAALNAVPMILLRLRGNAFEPMVELILALLCSAIVTLVICLGMPITRTILKDFAAVVRLRRSKTE